MSYLRTLKRGVLAAQDKLPKKKKWANKWNRKSETQQATIRKGLPSKGGY